jgi:3-oxoacyl-[acyl-carrier protein] reductase
MWGTGLRPGAPLSYPVQAGQRGGGHAFPVHAELGTMAGVDALLDELDKQLRKRGLPVGLDVLVNNAAVAEFEPLEQITPAEFDRVVAVNVKAPLFIIQRALPLMNDGGRIINISSAITRRPGPTAFVHAMTKAAVEVLGKPSH